MKLTEQQIREIADSLDSGIKCYYHLETGEIKSVIDKNKWIGAEEEYWEGELEEIENNRCDYFEFESMTTHGSFQVMTDFLEKTNAPYLQRKLIKALEKSKPFRHLGCGLQCMMLE